MFGLKKKSLAQNDATDKLLENSNQQQAEPLNQSQALQVPLLNEACKKRKNDSEVSLNKKVKKRQKQNNSSIEELSLRSISESIPETEDLRADQMSFQSHLKLPDLILLLNQFDFSNDKPNTFILNELQTFITALSKEVEEIRKETEEHTRTIKQFKLNQLFAQQDKEGLRTNTLSEKDEHELTTVYFDNHFFTYFKSFVMSSCFKQCSTSIPNADGEKFLEYSMPTLGKGSTT